jgi:hypothetical protein
MDEGERLRLRWRREHVVVHSRRVRCVTFDELVEDLLYRLNTYPAVARAESPDG